jgi:hypothetical protein
MRKFLLREANDKFYIEAKDLNDAKEKATIWNAEVIRELKDFSIPKKNRDYHRYVDSNRGK